MLIKSQHLKVPTRKLGENTVMFIKVYHIYLKYFRYHRQYLNSLQQQNITID